MRFRNFLFPLLAAAPLWARDQMTGNPTEYHPLTEASLAVENESLHDQPMTEEKLEETAAQIHDVNVVKKNPVPSIPRSLQKAVVFYSRPDLEAPIEIRLSDDPVSRFTRGDVKTIDHILAGMPADFLHGISYIESRPFETSPVSQRSGIASPMKLAEAAPDGLVIYAKPMLPDLLPEAIVLHYKTSHAL